MGSKKLAAIALILWGGSFLPAAAQPSQRVAFFGFDLINTSLEPTSTAETERLHRLDELFRQKLGASTQYVIVAIPPGLQAELAGETEIRNCNGCERDWARKAGAELAAWGTVQKVSNLILNINLYMENVETGEMAFVKSVDIRGNTDESWQHGLNYMLRQYLLKQP